MTIRHWTPWTCVQGVSTHEQELEEARDAVARVEREYDLLEEQARMGGNCTSFASAACPSVFTLIPD